MNAVTLVEHGRVAGRREVLGDHERQPVAVVGDVRAHASARERLPPVQHVALGELVARGLDDLLAHEVGPRDEQREAVLQLVAEAVRARATGRSPCGPTAGTRSPGRAAWPLTIRSSCSSGVSTCDRAEQVAPEVGAARRGRRRRALRLAVARDELARLLERGGLAEQEADLGRLARRELDRGHAAHRSCRGSGPRSRRAPCGPSPPDRPAGRCGRRTPCGSRSSECSGRSHARNAQRPGKSRLRWLCAVSISVSASNHVTTSCCARERESPSTHSTNCVTESVRGAVTGVGEPQAADAHGVLGGDEPVELVGDAVRLVLEADAALAVADDVGLGRAHGQRRRAPELAGLLVADVDRFAAAVGDRVVVPRGDAVLVAVERPRAADAGLARPCSRTPATPARRSTARAWCRRPRARSRSRRSRRRSRRGRCRSSAAGARTRARVRICAALARGDERDRAEPGACLGG